MAFVCVTWIGLYFTDLFQNVQQLLNYSLFLIMIDNHAKTKREIFNNRYKH